MKLSQFFEKINKINKLLPGLIKKMKRTQINVSHKKDKLQWILQKYKGLYNTIQYKETTILSQASIANKLSTWKKWTNS